MRLFGLIISVLYLMCIVNNKKNSYKRKGEKTDRCFNSPITKIQET